MIVEWPGRRADILNALELLADETPDLGINGRDQRWPDLTNAVHWLVDDTGWDFDDPSKSAGTILRNGREAAAVARVVATVVAISERQGAAATDAKWFGDQEWHQVQSRARMAIAAFRSE